MRVAHRDVRRSPGRDSLGVYIYCYRTFAPFTARTLFAVVRRALGDLRLYLQPTSSPVSRTIANGEDSIGGTARAGVISRRSNSRERTCVRRERNWRRSRKNGLAESSAIVSSNALLDTAVSLSLVSRKQNGTGETVRDTSARSYLHNAAPLCVPLFASYRGLRVRRW